MNPGSVIASRFELVRKVGAGAMGAVWRAVDRRDQRPVAVKLLAGQADPARFEREAALLAQLVDPGIVRYLAHGVTPAGARYLVMEWLDGETLAAVLGRGLTLRQSAAVIARAAAALAAAHRAGVVHRDIKPSNIFVAFDGAGEPLAVKVIDFGVARRKHETMSLTVQGTMVGSPGYMAPEQAAARGAIDPRADTFALGCVLYECLSGRAPFAGEHLMAVLAKVLLSEPAPIRQLRPEVSEPLAALLSSMLAKQAAARPSCERVAVELAAIPLPQGDVRVRRAGAEPPTEVAPPPAQGPLTCLLLASAGEEELPADVLEPRSQELAAALAATGAQVELLADGTAVARVPIVAGDAGAARRVVACAAALRAVLPDAALAIACRRDAELGELIDAGARVVGSELMNALLAAAGGGRPAHAVAVDDAAAQLLAASATVGRDASGAYVVIGA